ncbi:helix-turn-helix transcriptional regulator [Paenibacillus amylolyticus]|nr:helix-turn-helix transcriptional regulator [Paenibacillus amylolyticus]
MGINVSEFIDDCRIRKAKELLQNTNLMVREVALQVGYEAAHSFTRLFKKITGMTPQEYQGNPFWYVNGESFGIDQTQITTKKAGCILQPAFFCGYYLLDKQSDSAFHLRPC